MAQADGGAAEGCRRRLTDSLIRGLRPDIDADARQVGASNRAIPVRAVGDAVRIKRVSTSSAILRPLSIQTDDAKRRK
jgi:hypothetical protein